MECWGVGPFENQEALDWLEELAVQRVHPDEAVRAVLAAPDAASLAQCIQLICAAVIAANTALHVRRIAMPSAAWQWLAESGFDCSTVPRNDYRAALYRVADASALDQQWRRTSEYAGWRALLVRIEQRFTPQPRLRFEHPDYANRTEPFWYWRIRRPQIQRALLRGSFGVDRRAFERLSVELQCGADEDCPAGQLHEAAQIVNRQLQLNGLGRLEDASLKQASLRFRTHRGMQNDALRLLSACLRPLGLPRDSVFFHASPQRSGPFNIARRLYPQRLNRHQGVPGTCLTKLGTSLRFQKPGNIFCYQALPGCWHYGRVMAIDADIGLGPDCLLLHFYRAGSLAMTTLPEFDLADLLFPAVVTDREAWARGMFQTLDKIKLTSEEIRAVGSMVGSPRRTADLSREALRAALEARALLAEQAPGAGTEQPEGAATGDVIETPAGTVFGKVTKQPAGTAFGDGTGQPAWSGLSFSGVFELDELICQAHDLPLSPLELED